jgi:hypothetical protein
MIDSFGSSHSWMLVGIVICAACRNLALAYGFTQLHKASINCNTYSTRNTCTTYMVSSQSEPRPRVATNNQNVFRGRFQLVEASKKDLKTISSLCVNVFFGSSMTKNPWKASMYQSLYSEQYDDLAGRASRLRESVMYKAIDTK